MFILILLTLQAPPIITLNGESRGYEISYVDPSVGMRQLTTMATWIDIKNLRRQNNYDFIVRTINHKGKYDGPSPLKGISIYDDKPSE